MKVQTPSPQHPPERFMPRNRVYYGEGIRWKLLEAEYWSSFQVKARWTPHRLGGGFDDGQVDTHRIKLSYFEKDERPDLPDFCKSNFFFKMTTDDHFTQSTKWLHDNLIEDNWYIFTITVMHHQQLFNGIFLCLNFDCAKKELYQAWRFDQLYVGYPLYDDPHWNEWGEPDPTDKQLIKHNKCHEEAGHRQWQYEKDADGALVYKYPEAHEEYIKGLNRT